MMHLQADTIAGAVSQMAYVIADGSREVAAVEQIPYVPGEVIGFDKIVIGSAACVLAYAWAAYEFGKVRPQHHSLLVRTPSCTVRPSVSILLLLSQLPTAVNIGSCGPEYQWRQSVAGL